MILINKIQVDPTDIIEICRYDKISIILAPSKASYHELMSDTSNILQSGLLKIKIKDEFALNDIKHYLVSKAKKSKHPDDRVLEYEWFPNFETRDNLINMRKTKTEFDAETLEMTESIKQYEEHNLDSTFLKEQLIERAIGTF